MWAPPEPLMTLFTDIKYLNLASTRLPMFKRKNDFLWNFRCPICGDSQKNKNKARGFVFQIKGELVYKCHNCQAALGLGKLIEFLDPVLAKEYKMEKFKESGKPSTRQRDMRKLKKVAINSAPKFKVNVLRDLTPLTELNSSHPAKEYILRRELPLESLYYTEKFKEWTNSVKPNTFEDTRLDEPRIIIPFRDANGDTFGFQGRSLSSDGLRYITVLLDDKHVKIFGLDTVNTTERVYIVEGPLDSLLVNNGVAMAGADVTNVPELNGADVVYVYDNEPRNKQITDRILKHIKDGHSVIIWPNEIKEKDINDMVLAGHNVQSILQSSTYRGLKATLKFNEWRK